MKRIIKTILVCLMFLCVTLMGTSSLVGQVRQPTEQDAPYIDALIEQWLAHKDLNVMLRRAYLSQDGRLPILLRFQSHTQASGALTELGKTHKDTVRISEQVGRFVSVRVNAWGEWSVVKALKGLESAKLALRKPSAPPMSTSRNMLSSDQYAGLMKTNGVLDGEGLTIYDSEPGLDVFHPRLFHGDGGYFDWTDVNDNGRFDIGDDGIDLDASGDVDETEHVALLQYIRLEAHSQDVIEERDTFLPSLDWIYLDTNGSGKREFGTRNNFEESTPAYGEPLFTPDDVNQNGRLDVGEKLIRLSTSKIKAMRVGQSSQVLRRGTNLIRVPSTPAAWDSAFGFSGAAQVYVSHATAVVDIMIGDLPLASRTEKGIVSRAEAIVAWGTFIEPLMWAINQRANIGLMEFGSLFWDTPLDGSDPQSELFDEGDRMGTTFVCAAGNDGAGKNGQSGNHGKVRVEGTQKTLELRGQTEGAITLHGRGRGYPIGKLVLPSGQEVSFLANDSPGVMVRRNISERGSWMIHFLLTMQAPGETRIVMEPGAEPFDAWIKTLAYEMPEDIYSGEATIWVPSTADSCITIGATPAHRGGQEGYAPWPEPLGQLRSFSSRGPRIDGVLKIDVLAPDNPLAASYTDYPGSDLQEWVAREEFGGTSGATPHVAGVVALMLQQGMDRGVIRQRLRDNAVQGSLAGEVPNHDWGYGILDMAKVSGLDADDRAPSVGLELIQGGQFPSVKVNSRDPEDGPEKGKGPLDVQVDEKYDGTYDSGDFKTLDVLTLENLNNGDEVKVRVRDSAGNTAEAVLTLSGWKSGTVLGGDAGASGVSGGACGCRLPHGNLNETFKWWTAMLLILAIKRIFK